MLGPSFTASVNVGPKVAQVNSMWIVKRWFGFDDVFCVQVAEFVSESEARAFAEFEDQRWNLKEVWHTVEEA
jgi:hypothetical protein